MFSGVILRDVLIIIRMMMVIIIIIITIDFHSAYAPELSGATNKIHIILRDRQMSSPGQGTAYDLGWVCNFYNYVFVYYGR